MVVGFIVALIVVLITFSQVATLLSATKQISDLKAKLRKSELKVIELEKVLSRIDRTLKEAKFLYRKGGPSRPYRQMSGSLDLYSHGRTATVKATFRPDTYA